MDGLAAQSHEPDLKTWATCLESSAVCDYGLAAPHEGMDPACCLHSLRARLEE